MGCDRRDLIVISSGDVMVQYSAPDLSLKS